MSNESQPQDKTENQSDSKAIIAAGAFTYGVLIRNKNYKDDLGDLGMRQFMDIYYPPTQGLNIYPKRWVALLNKARGLLAGSNWPDSLNSVLPEIRQAAIEMVGQKYGQKYCEHLAAIAVHTIPLTKAVMHGSDAESEGAISAAAMRSEADPLFAYFYIEEMTSIARNKFVYGWSISVRGFEQAMDRIRRAAQALPDSCPDAKQLATIDCNNISERFHANKSINRNKKISEVELLYLAMSAPADKQNIVERLMPAPAETSAVIAPDSIVHLLMPATANQSLSDQRRLDALTPESVKGALCRQRAENSTVAEKDPSKGSDHKM